MSLVTSDDEFSNEQEYFQFSLVDEGMIGQLPNFLKVYVRRMIVNTACKPLNFLWGPFALKEAPYLMDYYKLDCRKSENMKIRRLLDQN